MMSPTSYAQNITSSGDYIFRTVPNIRPIADRIVLYAINNVKKTNFLICVNRNTDNVSFKSNLIEAIKNAGGSINPTDCNILASQFDPNAVIAQAKNSGANALVLGLYIDRSRDTNRQGIALVRANQGQLTLFGTPSLYTQESLQEGKDINHIIIPTPWHPTAFPNNPFVQKANELWKAPVNWRTATTYDATKAIIAGLQKSNTREELQKTLHSPDFSVEGATGKIQFSQSGDRIDNKNNIFLMKVQQIPGTDKYKFEPIKLKP